jgi:RNA polymerase sigma factor (sigma-70 family)
MPATVLRLLGAAAPETLDAELLARFRAERDESAFAELVRRHGPSVWRICRRLVGPSSADDAFQATFLILACRADSVRKTGSVGSWLVGVAGRVARQMRKRDQRAERLVRRLTDRASTPQLYRSVATDDLGAILDEELTRLPDDLRDPVVLCLLHGKTQDQAAGELGGSVRTIRRRLDQAKTLLRLRLERRGVVPVIAAGLVAGSGSPVLAVPPGLVQKTVRSAVEYLTGGVTTPAVLLAKGISTGTAKWKAGSAIAAAAAMVWGLGFGLAGDQPTQSAEQPLVPLVATLPLSDADRTPAATVPAGTKPIGSAAVRMPNFIVFAPTELQARLMATEAEHQRREVAKRWLGKELPAWTKPCEIRFTPDERATGGATTFSFGPPRKPDKLNADLASAEMILSGPFLRVVEEQLPHEVTHAVLASHFGQPLPRWVDEGIAILSEPAQLRNDLDLGLREVLSAGRAIRLKHLFRMNEYPKDTLTVYSQGHSVVQFLLSRSTTEAVPIPPADANGEIAPKGGLRNPHRDLIQFVQHGLSTDWDNAAKQIYGFATVDDLETAWIEWLKMPANIPKGNTVPKPTSRSQQEKPELIPPTKLPGVKEGKPIPMTPTEGFQMGGSEVQILRRGFGPRHAWILRFAGRFS